MARGDQMGRQWKIIQILVSSRKGKSAAELAQELECHPRTLYRDLEALQIAGFPIYTERVDGKNLWSLLDTVKHQIPIPFNLTELMALYFSRDMMRVFKDTPFYDSLESLFQKIKTTLPPESIKYLENIEQTLHLGVKPYKEYGKFRGILNQVNEAAINHKSIEIVYFTMSRKEESRRRVDPYRIWFFKRDFLRNRILPQTKGSQDIRFGPDQDASSDKGRFRNPEGFQPEKIHCLELRGVSGRTRIHKGMVSSGCRRLYQRKNLA